jgi:glutamate--cysteine ligase regulatory subunit
MGGGPSVIRRPTSEKSNTELTSSLRANFSAQLAPSSTNLPNGAPTAPTRKPLHAWTAQQDSTLYIPALDVSASALAEERAQYDITVKLFYLPNIPASARCAHTRDAIDLVLRSLHVRSIDLLIVSFPGTSFDADDSDSEAEAASPSADSPPPEDMETTLQTWRALEALHAEGVIAKLGVAEFGTQRLSRFLPRTRVRPAVDQINVRDCCVVPKPLILYAKEQGVELLTHNDCTNVLPRGTLRELLGPGEKGAGVLAGPGAPDGLKGDVEPQWVVKYTAVVKDRGVVESKGYFAVAELREE